MLDLLENRRFTMIWAGQSVSAVGDWVRNMALTYWAYQVSGHSPLATAAVTMAEYLPMVVAGPPAGVLVERWSKRKVMFWTQVLNALLSFSYLAVLQWKSLPLTIAVALLGNTVSRFYAPARASMIPVVVEREFLVGANSLSQMTANLALVLGPVIGTAVYFSMGAGWAFSLDAISFVISAAAVALAGLPENPVSTEAVSLKTLGRDMKAGVIYLWNNVYMRTATASLSVAMLGAGAVNVCSLYLVTRNLGLPEAELSSIMSAQGLAMVAGSIFIMMVSRRLTSPRPLVWIGLAGVGLGIMGSGLSPSLVWMIGFTVVVGISNAALNIGFATLLQTAVEREYMARVIGVADPTAMIFALAGAGLGGVLAKGMDVRPIMVAGGLIILGGAVVAFLGLREGTGKPRVNDRGSRAG